MSKHEKMESFFVSRMPTKKINMLPMCNNKKWICKTCDAQKHDVNLFCAIQNLNFTFFWHVVILLLLCNNKNISPWHNSFKSPKQKFGVAEKNFVLTNMQKVVYNARKSTSCRPKESFMPKQTNKQTKTTTTITTTTKNRFLLDSKMFPVQKSYYFFPERRPTLRSSHQWCSYKKKCSENIQERTPMPKCVFNQRTPLSGCFWILLFMWEN